MDVFQMAKEQWGKDSQIRAAIEELCEASAALARFQNGKCAVDEVYEELADAEIMLEQMRCYFSSVHIDVWKQKKLDRLKTKLNSPNLE